MRVLDVATDLTDTILLKNAMLARTDLLVQSEEGPDVRAGPTAALNLTLMINELATNAVKYGSLSVPEGKGPWAVSGTPMALHLRWQESGGPDVFAPSRKGFGSRLTERSFVGGDATLS